MQRGYTVYVGGGVKQHCSRMGDQVGFVTLKKGYAFAAHVVRDEHTVVVGRLGEPKHGLDIGYVAMTAHVLNGLVSVEPRHVVNDSPGLRVMHGSLELLGLALLSTRCRGPQRLARLVVHEAGKF